MADGSARYFLTWGRIQDPVDSGPVCELVLQACGGFVLGGEPATARVCDTLREAAESRNAPCFYECFVKFAQEHIPLGAKHEAWRRVKDELIRSGREIAYCGSP